jgi:GntR family transcriptional regulator
MTRGRELPSERVENDLRRRIAAHEWQPGEALPTVARLAESYQVSTASVGKALARLREAGLIETRERWGSFVL